MHDIENVYNRKPKLNCIVFTIHAKIRAQERLQLNEKQLTRLAKKAIRRGRTWRDFNAHTKVFERQWLQDRERLGCAIVYKNACLIFAANKCITVYILPQWFDHLSARKKGTYLDAI